MPLEAAVAPNALNLHLACRGSGERTVVNKGGAVTGAGLQIAGRNVGGNASASVGSMTSKTSFSEQMDVSIVDGKGRVRIPRRFLPVFNSNRDGWVNLANIKVRKDEISGNLDVSWGDHPKIRIDRLAGSVVMDGKIGAFYGQCQSLDPDHPAF